MRLTARAFLNDYGQLAQKYQCLIIFLHHTGKRTEDSNSKQNNLLGSQGFEAKMRTVIESRLDSLNATKKRHLCIVKANYLPKEYKNREFRSNFREPTISMTNERTPFDELKSSNKVDFKDRIKDMYAKGLNQSDIARQLKISQSTVSRSFLNV